MPTETIQGHKCLPRLIQHEIGPMGSLATQTESWCHPFELRAQGICGEGRMPAEERRPPQGISSSNASPALTSEYQMIIWKALQLKPYDQDRWAFFLDAGFLCGVRMCAGDAKWSALLFPRQRILLGACAKYLQAWWLFQADHLTQKEASRHMTA